MNGYFTFDCSVTATADKRMDNSIVKKLWNSFCLKAGTLELTNGDGLTFRMGDTALPSLKDGAEYALCVTEKGVAITGRNYGGLMRGFFSLIMKIECDGGTFRIKTVTEDSGYKMKNRMIHICVFPENDLYFIKKLVRLSALCGYTHIVIEFWGMLKYDCLKELAWPHAFTKAQSKEIIDECRMLGLETIPMFNQLGHATASRIMYGKHVVLDQDPRLEYLFTPDGWAWDIHSDKVTELFRKIRAELYELFGEGEYMHIGCDEAYYYTHHDDERKQLPEFLASLTSEVVSEGRRPMVWMDMMIEKGKYPLTTASCRAEDVEPLIGALHKASVLIDWQYHSVEKDIPSLVDLGKRNFDVMGAPWLDPENYKAHVDTVTDHNMFGVMLTTWHTLSTQMQGILGCAKSMGAVTFPWSEDSKNPLRCETAALLRRVSFEGNSYTDSGWAKEQIDVHNPRLF